ncbi:MAG: DUF4330 domain-containing protein [Lachnospirales bacterium]
MNNKFKIGGKIAIVDILIVLALCLLMYFLNILSTPESIQADDGIKNQFTIEIINVKAGMGDTITIGDDLYDSLKNVKIGKIVDSYTEPYMNLTENNETNSYDNVPINGLENIYIVIEANLTTNPNSTSAGNFDVMVGKEVFVKSKSFAGNGYVVKLDR